ncbi:hypothetical protein BH11PSE9_BH11PSE9_08610 [soil metagenome]
MNIRQLATRPVTRLVPVSIAGLSLAVLTACGSAPRHDDRAMAVQQAPLYSQNNAPQYVMYGEVRNIDVVPIAKRNNAGGAVLGAVLGAVIGNQFGAGTGRALATGAGAVGGAVIGNNVQNRNRKDDEVYHVDVRFENGDVREFDFQRIDDLRVGDRVKYENGQIYRL